MANNTAKQLREGTEVPRWMRDSRSLTEHMLLNSRHLQLGLGDTIWSSGEPPPASANNTMLDGPSVWFSDKGDNRRVSAWRTDTVHVRISICPSKHVFYNFLNSCGEMMMQEHNLTWTFVIHLSELFFKAHELLRNSYWLTQNKFVFRDSEFALLLYEAPWKMLFQDKWPQSRQPAATRWSTRKWPVVHQWGPCLSHQPHDGGRREKIMLSVPTAAYTSRSTIIQ